MPTQLSGGLLGPATGTGRLTGADASGMGSGLPNWLAQCRGSLSSLNQSLGSGPFGS
jgi:hypothetical protein